MHKRAVEHMLDAELEAIWIMRSIKNPPLEITETDTEQRR